MRTHGRESTYNSGCRCDECRAAATANRMTYRDRKKADGFSGLTHGKPSTYNCGCRCDECRASWASYAKSNNSQRAHRAARERAAAWVHEQHPDVWRQFVEEARAAL